jgi:hypothetical protein
VNIVRGGEAWPAGRRVGIILSQAENWPECKVKRPSVPLKVVWSVPLDAYSFLCKESHSTRLCCGLISLRISYEFMNCLYNVVCFILPNTLVVISVFENSGFLWPIPQATPCARTTDAGRPHRCSYGRRALLLTQVGAPQMSYEVRLGQASETLRYSSPRITLTISL